MKVPWNFFARRRGYDLSKMLTEGWFKTYNDYAEWCDNKDVAPLDESEFKAHLPPKQKPKPKPKPKSKPRTSRKVVKKEAITVSTKETKQEKENE